MMTKSPQRCHASIWPFVEFVEGGCWLWHGKLDRDGYPRLVQRMPMLRWLYGQAYAPIPKGYEPDHLCRVRNCINLDHAEVVTHGVNTLRGNAPPAINKRKTHCCYGHPFDERNTYRRGNCRTCRTCVRLRAKWRYHEDVEASRVRFRKYDSLRRARMTGEAIAPLESE
jgi:hypothetical protein